MPVDLERRDAVAVLTINRPEALNALSPELLDDLDRCLDEVAAAPELRAVVITGAGQKAFSAGADIAHMRTADALQARAWAQRGQGMADRIESFDAPVIAAVNGYALGGGCEIALACDVLIASERARFGQPEINLGIVTGWGGSQRLTRLVAPGYAKEMILTGAPIDAAEALRVGLVNHVYPADDLLDRAVELAAVMASKPVWAAAASKALCNAALADDLASGLAREVDAFALAFTTADQREGMDAFFEKRPPKFA